MAQRQTTDLHTKIFQKKWTAVKKIVSTHKEWLIYRGGEFGRIPLSFALVQNEAPEDIYILLTSKTPKESLNSQDNDGFTALIVACQNGHVECAKLLLEAKAGINLQTNEGGTALYFACQIGHVKCARLLLEANADINVKANDGFTALIIACEKGQVECAKLLLEAKAGINVQANEGGTALYLACNQGHVQCARLLLEANADINVKTNRGSTPLHGCFYDTERTYDQHLSVSICLLKYDRNMAFVKNMYGKSPVDMYEEHKCEAYPEESRQQKKMELLEILKGGALPSIPLEENTSSGGPLPSTSLEKSAGGAQPSIPLEESTSSDPTLISAHGPEQTKYFIEAKKEGAVDMNLGKVMVMGREGAGKSCLISSFLGLEFNEKHDITDCIAAKQIVSKSTAEADEWEEKSDDGGAAEIYMSGVAHIMTRKILNTEEEGTPTKVDASKDQQPSEESPMMEKADDHDESKFKQNLQTSSEGETGHVQSETRQRSKSAKIVLKVTKKGVRQQSTLKLLESDDEDIDMLQEGPVPENIQKKIEDRLKQIVKKKQTLGKWHKAQDGTFHIMDFGGQLIYKGIQRILMVSEAVYLVVFNLEEDLDSFAFVQDSSKEWHIYHMTHLEVILYWIRNIYSDTQEQKRSSESGKDLPEVVIVGTHSESSLLGETENERRQTAEEKFNKIKKALSGSPFESHVHSRYFRVENKFSLEDDNIVELKKELEGLMKKMVKTVPLKWVDFQSEIQKLSEKKVTCPLEEVQALARKCGISDKETQFALLDYLYDLGEIIFIRTIEALQNVVVINPMSLVDYCKVVFTVLIPDLQAPDMKQSWRKLDKGILEERLLRFLWKDIVDDLDDNFEFLVNLMERFGLLCERKTSKDCDTTERVFYTPLRLKPTAGQQRLAGNYGMRAVSIYHDFCGYLPDELFPQTVTRFIEKFQVEGVEPELAHEHAELYFDDSHHVVFSVVTIKQRRMFKTTIVRGNILNETNDVCEPAPAACKQVLKFLKTAFELHNVNDRRGIHVKLCIPCPCNKAAEHMQMLTDLKQDLLPCGRDRVRITRYQRLFGDCQESEKGSILDDKQLLRICDAMDSNWRRLGVHLGLGHVEIQRLECDSVQEKDAVMAMFVSWRNQQPSDINQVSVMIASLHQRGYIQLAEQLRGDFGLPANFSGFLHDNDLMLISNGIGVNSSKVAIHLGLNWNDVSSAETQHQGNAFKVSMELLTTWRKRQPNSNNQLHLMCKALEQERFTSVAQQLRSNVEPASDLGEDCLDDKALLSICDEMDGSESDWRLVGIQLGLQLSEIECIEKDKKHEKSAMMAMLVSWRNRQPSNINQRTVISAALAQRGYLRLSTQLTGNLVPSELSSEHQPSACALCSLCSDEAFSPPNDSNIPQECVVDEAEFRPLLLEISNNMDEEDLQVLKVALTDHIKDAQTIVGAQRATELFESLIKQDMLSPDDLRILLEVTFMKTIGIPAKQGSIVMTIKGAADMIGRLLAGILGERLPFQIIHMYVICTGIMAITTYLVTYAYNVTHMVFYAIFIGFFNGVFNSLLFPTTTQLFRKDLARQAWAFCQVPPGIAIIIGPGVAGFIYDATKSYTADFYVNTGIFELAMLIFASIPAIRLGRWLWENKKQPEESKRRPTVIEMTRLFVDEYHGKRKHQQKGYSSFE